MAKLTAQINADASQFLDVIKAVLKSADEAQKAIQKAFGESGDIKVNDSAIKDAIDSANKLSKELKSMSGKVDVNDSEIDSATKKVKQLDGSEVKVKVEADTSGLEGLTSGLSDAFSGGLIGGLAGGGIASLVETGIGAIVSGLGAAYEAGNQFNTALGDMQAKTGATAEEMVALQKASEDAFLGGVGGSVAEATNIIANAQTRLGDFLDPKQLSEFTIGAQALGNTFDLDVNEVITKASPVIKQFGLDSKEAFDLLAFSAQNGASASDDFLDTLSEYSQLAQEAGFSALEFGDAIARGTEAGVFNTDKIGDAIKEAQIRITAGDFESAFKGLSESASEGEKSVISLVESIAQKAQSGELSIQDALQFSSAEIDKAFDSGQISEAMAKNLQVAIAGTPAEDLGRDVYSRIFSAPFDENAIREKAQKAGESLSGAIGQYTSFDAVQRKFELGITKISQAFIFFSDKVIAPIVGGVIEAFAGIQDAFDSVFGDFELDGGITDALDGLLNIFDAIVVVVRDTLGGVFRAVFGVIKSVFEGITTAVKPIFNLFSELASVFQSSGDSVSGFGDILTDVGDIIGEIGSLIFEFIITPFELMIDLVVDVYTAFLEFTGILGESKDASSGFGNAIDIIRNALNNVKGTIGGVIETFRAFKDAIKNLDFSKVVTDLLSGKNPFAGIGDSLSDAYDKGFNKATGKFKDATKEQSEVSKELFNQINSQIEALASNRDKMSNEEIATEKKKFASIINQNLEASKLIKGDAVKLNNALEQIKAKDFNKTSATNTKIKDSYKDLGNFLTTDFKNQLKDAFNLDNFDSELQLSEAFIDVKGILQGFKQPVEEFKTALTGVRFEDNQLDTITAFIDDINVAIDGVKSLKDNLEQTPQFLKNLVEETGKLSSEFEKYSNDNDKVLTKLKNELSDIQIEFNSADSEEQQVAILNRLLAKYEEYNKQILKTANVSKDDRKRLEEKFANDVIALQERAKNLTTEEFNKQLEALTKQRDDSLKIQADRIAKTKEAEEGLLDFFENRRVDAITDANEKARITELKDLDRRYEELIQKYGTNEEAITRLREAFAEDRAKIIEKYTEKEIDVLGDLSRALVRSLASFDATELLKQNEALSESINGVTEDYDNQFKEFQDKLRSGELSQREYNESIIDLEKEKNDKLKELEDQRVGFTELANANIANSFKALNETISELLQERSEKFAETIENDKEANTEFTQFISDNMALAVASIGASLGEAVANGENFFQSLIKSTLSTAQVLLNAWAAPLLLKANTELPLGLGTIEFGLLLAAANTLLATAQAGIGGANDGVIGLNESNKGKPRGADSILMMLAPNESVITAQGTAKNKPYLEFINKGGNIADLITPNVSINPKYANGNSMDETNKRLDETNRRLDMLNSKFGTMKVSHFHDKQPTVNVNNTIEIKSQRGRV